MTEGAGKLYTFHVQSMQLLHIGPMAPLVGPIYGIDLTNYLPRLPHLHTSRYLISASDWTTFCSFMPLLVWLFCPTSHENLD